MLVTRGLGGVSPGLVTAGLGSFIDIPPTPAPTSDGGGGGWIYPIRRRKAPYTSPATLEREMLALARREDEEIIKVIEVFLRTIT
jgi:hypothetical protein